MGNIIYTNLFEEITSFKKLKEEGRIVNTPWRDKESENSFSFKVGDNMPPSNTKDYKERLLLTIKGIFRITNSSFDEKFYQVINGAGQEWKRLNVFHSSSLLCLLCFYNISEQAPLNITIDGKVCRFTASEFEVLNEIDKNKRHYPYYSHIDVKLSGLCEGKSVSLYLESKFSEYVNQRGAQKFTSTEEYELIYSKLDRKIEGLDISTGDDKIILKNIDNKRPAQYWQGIKQMVSHYLGMKNCKDTCDIKYLGEILYDFRSSIMEPDYFRTYENIHQQLVKALEETEPKPQTFKVGKNMMTYQDIFKNYSLDERVREIYNL